MAPLAPGSNPVSAWRRLRNSVSMLRIVLVVIFTLAGALDYIKRRGSLACRELGARHGRGKRDDA